MTQTMSMYHSKIPNPDLVFLLGDDIYNRKLASPSDYSEYFSHVAKGSVAPHYAILGNHDYDHASNVDILLSLGQVDPRWNMPSTYYFKKFDHDGFTICAWFLDTEKFDRTQISWLRNSIRTERPLCTWKIVSGHVPGLIQASGANMGSRFLSRTLEPLLLTEGIDVYLAGHHHNSQHLTQTANGHTVHVFIVGQVALRHGEPATATAGELIWGTAREPAILELRIDSNRILYNFHGTDSGVASAPIHSGIISHA